MKSESNSFATRIPGACFLVKGVRKGKNSQTIRAQYDCPLQLWEVKELDCMPESETPKRTTLSSTLFEGIKLTEICSVGNE